MAELKFGARYTILAFHGTRVHYDPEKVSLCPLIDSSFFASEVTKGPAHQISQVGQPN